MKVSFIQEHNANSTESRIAWNLVPKLEERGLKISVNSGIKDCDLILCLRGLAQDKPDLASVISGHPDKKSIAYVWDLYPWTKYTSGYEYLSNCTEVWAPSHEVQDRLQEFYKIGPEKCKVVKTYFESFEDEHGDLQNDNFILHPLRNYPDPQQGWLEKACSQLDIRAVRTHHRFSFEDYKQAVLSCSFLVCEYNEASTGGLGLLEGYYHGKNVLVSDSRYQGAIDYFGDRAYYFEDGNFNDFKLKIKLLFEKANDTVNLEYNREFCQQYNIDSVADDIAERLKSL